MSPARGARCAAGAALVTAVALLSAACGRKTFIRPPELAAPQRIENLAAANVADGVQLAWARPKTYSDGSRMTDLGAFTIERSTGGGPFVPVGTVEVTDRERLQQERRFRWVDTGASVGEIYAYRVLSATTDGYVSEPSNVAAIERAVPTRGAVVPTPTP
jgi:hypothetical protein